jgi:hypothetical protein
MTDLREVEVRRFDVSLPCVDEYSIHIGLLSNEPRQTALPLLDLTAVWQYDRYLIAIHLDLVHAGAICDRPAQRSTQEPASLGKMVARSAADADTTLVSAHSWLSWSL